MKRWLLGLLSLAITAAVAVLILLHHQPVALTIGVFAGSNWDVPGPNNYRLYDEAIARFESEHPGIRVSYRSGTLKEDYSEWLSQQLLKGKGPDVFMILPEDFNAFSSMNILKSLDEMMKKDTWFNAGAFYPPALTAGAWKEKYYGLPFELSPMLMFVNRTLLESEHIPLPEENWTWEDFYRIAKSIIQDTDDDGADDQYGFYGFTWEHAAQTNGCVLFDEAGLRANLTGDEMLEAVTFTRSLYNLQKELHVAGDDFDKGRVAFRPFLFSDYRTYKPYPYSVKKFSGFEWMCVSMPAGPHGQNASQLNALLMGVNAQTRHPQEAWELLKHFTCDPVTQMDIFRYSQGVSPLIAVTESQQAAELLQRDMPGDEQFIDLAMLGDVIRRSAPAPKFRRCSETISLMDSVLYRLVNNQGNIQTALSNLQRDVNRFLGK